MSKKYKVIDSTIPTFITITVVDWVDLFVRPIYSNILDDSLNYCSPDGSGILFIKQFFFAL